jgi:hypothetical protein
MKLNLVARIQDGGDGSQIITLYNSTNDLIADHSAVQAGIATAEEVLNENDPYGNGYITYFDLEVTVDGHGNAELIKPTRFSAGDS